MRRILVLLTVALVMAAIMVAMAMPAFADKGGFDHGGACGLGKSHVQRAIDNPVSPGASEAGRESPGHPGELGACTGKG